jgi:hypothetical protein
MPVRAPEVDVPTAKELLEQIHQHLSVQETSTLVGELEGKSRAIRELLAEGRLREAVEWTFVGRRRASAILGTRSEQELVGWSGDLLHGADALPVRFERFCAQCGTLDEPRAAELAAELLHFTDPGRRWLWSRWIWSRESRTGALALLIGEDYDLEAEGLGAGYERVGVAMGVLDTSPEASAFRLGGGGPFATDVLLACTYGVYMRTVLGLKMTEEFNALVPGMAQLVRRLLGTHRR